MKLLLYCLLAMLWPVGQTLAQTYPPLNTPLTVGQYLPAPFSIRTDDGKTIDLTAKNNQLYILNFMSVNCLSCIKALPDLTTLQKKWKDRFKLILVLSDALSTIEKFKNKNKLGRLLNFPSVISDTILKEWFPHTFISHEVWIKNGQVIAITGSEYITDGNIQKALNDPTFSLPIKEDKPDYDFSSNLLEPKTTLTTTSYYTVLLPYQNGIPRRYMEGVDSAKGLRWYRMINLSIVEMYSKIWKLPLYLPVGGLHLNLTDSSGLVFNDKTSFRRQWNMDNTFCYEAQFPLTYSDDACREKIRTDFAFWFPYKVSLISKSPLQLVFIHRDSLNSHHP